MNRDLIITIIEQVSIKNSLNLSNEQKEEYYQFILGLNIDIHNKYFENCIINYHKDNMMVKLLKDNDVATWKLITSDIDGILDKELVYREINRDYKEDIIQDVLVSIYISLWSFNYQSEFNIWLYNVIINAIRKHHRKIRSQMRRPNNIFEINQKEQSGSVYQAMLEEIKDILSQYNDLRLWDIFQLKLDGQSISEIASRIQISPARVSNLLTMTRDILRKDNNLVELFKPDTLFFDSNNLNENSFYPRSSTSMIPVDRNLFREDIDDSIPSIMPAVSQIDNTTMPTMHIPAELYLSRATLDEGNAVLVAITRVLDAFDLAYKDNDEPPIIASFWKRFFVRTKELAEEPAIETRLNRMERAIEMQVLHGPQASIDKNQAEAIALLIQSLQQTPDAVLQVGSLLLIKQTVNDHTTIMTRTLTQRELHYLEHNRHLIKQPHDILRALEFYAIKQMESRPRCVERNIAIPPKPSQQERGNYGEIQE